LEGSLTHHTVAGPAGEFDFGHQLWLDPMNAAPGPRRILAGKGAVAGLQLFQPRHQPLGLVGGIAGADPTDIDQVLATMHPNQEGAEVAFGGAPAADDDFMAGPAFGLDPAVAASAIIGITGALGDDTF